MPTEILESVAEVVPHPTTRRAANADRRASFIIAQSEPFRVLGVNIIVVKRTKGSHIRAAWVNSHGRRTCCLTPLKWWVMANGVSNDSKLGHYRNTERKSHYSTA